VRTDSAEPPPRPPPEEIQQIVAIPREGVRREAADVLGIKKVIDPPDRLVLGIEDAIGRNAGGTGLIVDDTEERYRAY
jgi:hypothetical protein